MKWSWIAGSFLVTVINLIAQPGPHQIDRIDLLPDRTVSLRLGGTPPAQFKQFFDIYVVQTSRNLNDWSERTTLLRTNASTNTLVFLDSPPGRDFSFYRVFSNQLVTPLPRPSGKYPVGSSSLLVTDSTRTNRYSVKTNSSFMITLWYPAVATVNDRVRYIESKVSGSFANLYGISQSTLAGFYEHSLLNASMDTNNAPYPVIIYSHGFRVSRRDNTAKCEELASQGFVVVAIDHSDCLATVFPDGKVFATSIGSLSLSLFTNNVRDIQFVLNDTLPRINETDPVLRHHLDLERVGTMGWSYGGGVAAEVARTDSRVKGAVLLEAYLQNAHDVAGLGIQKPVLALYNATSSFETTIFDGADHDAYWMQVAHTEHQHFADWLAWISSPTTNGRRASVAMSACMVSFFKKYLKDEDDHLLDNPSAVYADVFHFMKK